MQEVSGSIPLGSTNLPLKSCPHGPPARQLRFREETSALASYRLLDACHKFPTSDARNKNILVVLHRCRSGGGVQDDCADYLKTL
jgi:hypothetical protein